MDKPHRRVTADFAARTQDARKVLMVEIAGLGDLVHSLPAMWALRQGYPQAQLHCLVREPYASLLQRTPWIDRVLPYRRGGDTTVLDYLRAARRIRAEHYDVAIDFSGADHAGVAGWISGAPHRLVRKPGVERGRPAWRLLGAEVMEQPFGEAPMYEQCWRCVRQAGFEGTAPEFHLQPAAPAADAGTYLHLSPFSRRARKELPQSQMTALLIRLRESFPHLRIALSCGFAPRELAALQALVAGLPFKPWRVFAGTLDVVQLMSLIEGAALHLGGDSGALHLAWLAGTPSVSWFAGQGNFRQWVPQGARHRVVLSDAPADEHLAGIDGEALIAAAQSLLGVAARTRPRRENPPLAAVAAGSG